MLFQKKDTQEVSGEKQGRKKKKKFAYLNRGWILL